MSTISNLHTEYGNKSKLSLRRIIKLFIVSGKITNVESKRGCEYITVSEEGKEITGRIQQATLSKAHWIKFREKKVGDKISIQGNLYKTIKDNLGVEVEFVEG